LPGPFASLLLADLGAHVIKIEEPGGGDPVRGLPPFAGELSYRFALLNRNKRSLTLDLKSSAGREIFFKLARHSDVIFEGFRPGVVRRLQIDYESVRKIRPEIIYCSLSGYGQDGPYRERVGHDINYIGVAGLLNLTGEARPVIPAVPVADFAGALFAALSMVAALRAREQTGQGAYIDVSMTDAIASWMTLYAAEFFGSDQSPRRGELPLGGGWPYYNVYEARDGKYLSVGALEPKFWARLCEALGVPAYSAQQDSEAKRDEIFNVLREIFRTKTRDEWLAHLDGREIPVAPVHELHETFTDVQVQHRQLEASFAEPEGFYRYLRFPVQFSPPENRPDQPAPRLGQHTEEILKELGYDREQIDALRAQGVI
jgi:crotonobetainyl-CoA:carnitine CoA-transferase CaiB-like acyl-CoA transferase